MRVSARNNLEGVVKKVDKGAVAAQVKVEIQVPATVTAVVTKEAVEELDIKSGDRVKVLIKATEVMVAKE